MKNSMHTWCATCAFPPCAGCGRARPDHRQYHAKVMPQWKCADCTEKPCSQCGQPLDHKASADTWCQTCAYPPCAGCGRARPDQRKYHAKIMPGWKCADCADKPCSQCGQPLDHKASADTWCQTCAYPPCAGCGCARPDHREYHAKVMPHWKCADCADKPCSQCGQPLEHKAAADTWRQTCAYPPCASCGRARPDQRKYHAKVMPHWKCADCTDKPCSQCGQPLEHKAAADTWCQTCAYPPCPGCGALRPSQSAFYHVTNMPTWRCAVCRARPSDSQPNESESQSFAVRKRRRLRTPEMPSPTKQMPRKNQSVARSSLYDQPASDGSNA